MRLNRSARRSWPRLLGPAEAAAVLGITAAGVRWNADVGRLPCLRTPGGRRLFIEDAVRRFRAERAQRAMMRGTGHK